MIAAVAVVAVAAGAIGLGIWGVRLVRTTSDLYVASRAVTPWWNAAAISGEYLSAASFLGIAGLIVDQLLAFREEFPILEKTTYLVSNSLGAMPASVAERMAAFSRPPPKRSLHLPGETGRIISASSLSVCLPNARLMSKDCSSLAPDTATT